MKLNYNAWLGGTIAALSLQQPWIGSRHFVAKLPAPTFKSLQQAYRHRRVMRREDGTERLRAREASRRATLVYIAIMRNI